MEIEKDSFSSYPKIFALGHGCIKDIFFDDVVIEEKIDGSQFSFASIRGELKCRSKGAVLNMFAPEKMFLKGVETAQRLFDAGLLTPGWTYRGEYLQSPRHNTLAYNRVPEGNFIGFDISVGYEQFLSHDEKIEEFKRLGLECVPQIFKGRLESPEKIRDLMETDSILGGQKIEGVIVKNYRQLNPMTHQPMIGKFVSEAFKEVHDTSWKETNPGDKDIIELLSLKYRTPARWNKAVQHLAEKGQLEGSPKDIGALFKEVNEDTKEECSDEIKQLLFDWAWSKISRGLTAGLPEWYKDELLKKSFT